MQSFITHSAVQNQVCIHTGCGAVRCGMTRDMRVGAAPRRVQRSAHGAARHGTAPQRNAPYPV